MILFIFLALFIALSQAKVLTVTPTGRWLTAPVTISFKSDLKNPVFRYTSHWRSLGVRPTNTIGTVWNGVPITVSNNIIYTVIAYNATYFDRYSFEAHTYLFFDKAGKGGDFTWPQQDTVDAWKALPTVSISYPTEIPVISAASPTVPAQFEWLDPKDANARFFYISGVKYTGNYNVYLEKKSYRLYFSSKDYGGAGKMKEDIFANFTGSEWPYMLATDKFENFQLRSGSADSIVYMEMAGRGDGYSPGGSKAQYIRNQFGDELQMKMGHWSAHGRHCHVFDNGNYFGVYHIRERVDSNYLADYVGGTNKDYEFVNHCVIRDGDGSLWAKITSLQGNYLEFKKWVDVSNLADYLIIQQHNANFDVWACWNWQGYGPYSGIVDGGFQFFGSDIDLSYLSTSYGWKGAIFAEGPNDMWTSLWNQRHPDFVSLFHDRLYRHFWDDGIMMPANLVKTYRALMKQIDGGINAEVARWRGITVGNRFTKDRWLAGGEQVINEWLNGPRQTVFFQELVNRGWYLHGLPPTFEPLRGALRAGQPMVMTNRWAGATIYYTKDGTDPRMDGGAINPNAINGGSGSVTVTFTVSTTISARAYLNGKWSPIQDRSFYYPTPSLVGKLQITEVNYDRYEDVGYAEFIEIKNVDSSPVQLVGCTLEANNIRFKWDRSTIIPAGGYIVGTNQRRQFRISYGNRQANFFYTGNLKKSTKFKILDPWNNVIVAVEWKDETPFPLMGLLGYSLVPSPSFVYTPGKKANDGKDWRFSQSKKGSPWAADPIPLTLTDFDQGNNFIYVNEAMLNPKSGKRWIELRNWGTSAINVGNWAITKNPIDKPRQFVFKAGTTIPAGAYVIYDEDFLGFSLKGEEHLYILNNVTDYHINLPKKFLEDYSMGRFQTSDGKVHFTHMLTVTKSAINSAPYLPPVVISGFARGNAPFQNLQYIKLTSVSKNKDQDLTGWILAVGDEDFKFKKNGIHHVVLEPGQSVYLLNTTTSIAAFKAAYGANFLDPKAVILNVLKVKTFFDDIKLQKPNDGDEVTVDRFDGAPYAPKKKRDVEDIEDEQQQNTEITRTLDPLQFSLEPKAWRATTLPTVTPVNCQWSSWGVWGACACGVGMQSRVRTSTAPKFGGTPCNDLDGTETRACGQTGPCDCSFGAWAQWGSCTKTCGEGQRTRTRPQIAATNGGKPCNAADATVVGPCMMADCPVDCLWDQWSLWSECSAVQNAGGCGSGTQTRARGAFPAQAGGAPCSTSEATRETVPCSIPCPEEPANPPIPFEETFTWMSTTSITAVFGVLLALLLLALVCVVILAIYSLVAKPEDSGGYQQY